jgi:hypothetical protein
VGAVKVAQVKVAQAKVAQAKAAQVRVVAAKAVVDRGALVAVTAAGEETADLVQGAEWEWQAVWPWVASCQTVAEAPGQQRKSSGQPI